jgi:GDPmannose 4,6-dehydratase
MAKSALITGVLGQDGAYLSRFLLSKGYRVVGLDHGGDRWRLEELGIVDDLRLVDGDVRSTPDVIRAVTCSEPDEIYSLAALSSVRESFVNPVATAEVTAIGAMRLLEVFRSHAPEARFYQASSSEMFGQGAPALQDEATPFAPSSPYAAAKLHAHQMTRSYRHAYGLFASCGILFNHESPLRAPGFVTRKITRAAAAIAAGKQREIRLGNLDSRRDFGYSPEYVEAMWLMLQQENPGDYVVATGEAHSIHQFAEKAFQIAGLSLEEHLVTDPSLLRPADPGLVCGNPAKARRELGWEAKTGFEDLVHILVEAEQARVVQDPE